MDVSSKQDYTMVGSLCCIVAAGSLLAYASLSMPENYDDRVTQFPLWTSLVLAIGFNAPAITFLQGQFTDNPDIKDAFS